MVDRYGKVRMWILCSERNWKGTGKELERNCWRVQLHDLWEQSYLDQCFKLLHAQICEEKVQEETASGALGQLRRGANWIRLDPLVSYRHISTYIDFLVQKASAAHILRKPEHWIHIAVPWQFD